MFQPLAVERVRVVGFGYLADEVLPTELFPRERALVSPDLARRFACTFEDLDRSSRWCRCSASATGCSTQYRYFSLDIADDPASAASIRSQFSVAAERLADTIPAEIAEIGAGYYYIGQERADVDDAVRQMTRPTVAVLGVFGVLAGLVTVTVTGFALVRLGRRSAPDLQTLRASARPAATSQWPSAHRSSVAAQSGSWRARGRRCSVDDRSRRTRRGRRIPAAVCGSPCEPSSRCRPSRSS